MQYKNEWTTGAQLQTVAVLLSVVMFLSGTACTSSSGSDPSPGASTAIPTALTVTPSPATVTPSGTLTFVPTGGTAPYTFSLLPSTIGTLSPSSGTTTVFTASATAGTGQLQVLDAVGNLALVNITVGSSSTTLTVSPLATSVAAGGAVSFSVSGGTPPYTYTVLTAGGGTFTANVFYAPSTAQTVTVQIADSALHAVTATVTVTSTTPTPVPWPTGSFVYSCFGCYVDTVNTILYCYCDTRSHWANWTSINYSQCANSSMGNIDGILTCGQ